MEERIFLGDFRFLEVKSGEDEEWGRDSPFSRVLQPHEADRLPQAARLAHEAVSLLEAVAGGIFLPTPQHTASGRLTASQSQWLGGRKESPETKFRPTFSNFKPIKHEHNILATTKTC